MSVQGHSNTGLQGTVAFRSSLSFIGTRSPALRCRLDSDGGYICFFEEDGTFACDGQTELHVTCGVTRKNPREGPLIKSAEGQRWLPKGLPLNQVLQTEGLF